MRPGLRTWGLSATLDNLDEALATLVGVRADKAVPAPALIRGDDRAPLIVETILPESVERFPWAGHLGLRLLEPALEHVARARSTLIFTNTRSQAELWFRAVVQARPHWIGEVAIHHGSIGREIREEVESRLREGRLRCVVCTSSLDLGVDFSPVDQVIQVGSPKGVARFLQRAGRSGHRPGAPSRIVCVPTNALELAEFAAARDAALARRVEPRSPLRRPLDVLAQHLVTVALGGAFHVEPMLDEVRTTHAYHDLCDEEWRWCLEFVTRGGAALGAYPRFARLAAGEDGALRAASPAVARTHRLGIGTISSDASMLVRMAGGKTLGSIEEGFIARLAPGDRFVFAGRALELDRVRDMTAFVRPARSMRGAVPQWGGGRSPLSTHLAQAVRGLLAGGGAGVASPEMAALGPLLRLQARWSRLPEADALLIESVETPEGFHAFLYPFEGRLVHEGLGALLAHRLAAASPRTITVSANDYGIELLSGAPLSLDESAWRRLLSTEALLEDLLRCLNSTELTRRQFRDIARVAGLITPGYPGAPRKARQVQASSDLFFDVFAQFDPGNLLLDQARREVLDQQLEAGRMRAALERLAGQRIAMVSPPRLTPLSVGLWAESLRTQQVTSESWGARVARMVAMLESEAGGRPASAAGAAPRAIPRPRVRRAGPAATARGEGERR
jgi:ATP-dependent Lhr-like helicase